jgi:hypothetical protein
MELNIAKYRKPRKFSITAFGSRFIYLPFNHIYPIQ